MIKVKTIFSIAIAGCIALTSTLGMAATIHAKVNSCTTHSQNFKFRNTLSDTQFVVFDLTKNQNVKTTLHPYNALEAGDSNVFVNQFTAANQAFLEGEAKVFGHPYVERLCKVQFDCSCSADGCLESVTTIGTRCDIDGNGTSTDPYVFILK